MICWYGYGKPDSKGLVSQQAHGTLDTDALVGIRGGLSVERRPVRLVIEWAHHLLWNRLICASTGQKQSSSFSIDDEFPS
jgi:hypothetical protein